MTLLLLLPLLPLLARAEHAGTLDGGSVVVYAGPGLTTYAQLTDQGSSGTTLARATAVRLDLYGAWGVTDRVQLSAYVPVIHSFAEGGREPCVSIQDCTPISGVGAAGAQARFNAVRGPFQLTVGLGVSSAAWLADVRGRYTMVGEATTDVQPAIYAGKDFTLGGMNAGVVLFGNYNLRFTAYDQAVKAPADDVRAGLELKVSPGPLTAQLGTYTLQRLGGNETFASDASEPDQWALNDYDNVSVGAKLSFALSADMGVHLGANRVVWVDNGPPDALDVSIGFHKWFAPPS